MKLTLYAIHPDVAAIFRREEEFFLSPANEPSRLIPMDEKLVHSFVIKWGYSLTQPMLVEPAEWRTAFTGPT